MGTSAVRASTIHPSTTWDSPYHPSVIDGVPSVVKQLPLKESVRPKARQVLKGSQVIASLGGVDVVQLLFIGVVRQLVMC